MDDMQKVILMYDVEQLTLMEVVTQYNEINPNRPRTYGYDTKKYRDNLYLALTRKFDLDDEQIELLIKLECPKVCHRVGLDKEAFSKNFELFKLVVVENMRFQRANGTQFDKSLASITYNEVEDWAWGVVDSYNEYTDADTDDYEFYENIHDSETFRLMFTYLIVEGLHHIDGDDPELLELIAATKDVITATMYYIENAVSSCYYIEEKEGK